MPAIDVIRSATLIGAEVVRQEGKLGSIAPGAFADLLVVDGDPLKDLGLFQDGGPNLPAIMKAGRFHKNRCASVADLRWSADLQPSDRASIRRRAGGAGR